MLHYRCLPYHSHDLVFVLLVVVEQVDWPVSLQYGLDKAEVEKDLWKEVELFRLVEVVAQVREDVGVVDDVAVVKVRPSEVLLKKVAVHLLKHVFNYAFRKPCIL